ncbi:hypothetical protein A2U01_0073710, partial [Trifolium medium]|nr:hypothetical protein [Trifolium medium]
FTTSIQLTESLNLVRRSVLILSGSSLLSITVAEDQTVALSTKFNANHY